MKNRATHKQLKSMKSYEVYVKYVKLKWDKESV